MFAMVSIDPNLSQTLSIVCKYMSKPGMEHCNVVKWVLIYLKGTQNHGLIFESGENDDLDLYGYVDFDYVGDRP